MVTVSSAGRGRVRTGEVSGGTAPRQGTAAAAAASAFKMPNGDPPTQMLWGEEEPARTTATRRTLAS